MRLAKNASDVAIFILPDALKETTAAECHHLSPRWKFLDHHGHYAFAIKPDMTRRCLVVDHRMQMDCGIEIIGLCFRRTGEKHGGALLNRQQRLFREQHAQQTQTFERRNREKPVEVQPSGLFVVVVRAPALEFRNEVDQVLHLDVVIDRIVRIFLVEGELVKVLIVQEHL